MYVLEDAKYLKVYSYLYLRKIQMAVKKVVIAELYFRKIFLDIFI